MLRFLASFVDGTVEGTSILSYKTDSAFYQMTYYGNGCPNGWNDSKPYHGGSIESCTSRLVNTADNETQTIGTYYTFQAAALDSGKDGVADENSVAPDTFCPLGWQLPYGGTGGDYYDKPKSWRYLFNEYGYSIADQDLIYHYQTRIYPFSYIQSGDLRFYEPGLYMMNLNGFYSSSVGKTINNRASFEIYPGAPGGFTFKNAYNKAVGQAIRCTKFLASNHRRHGGRNKCILSRYRLNS